MRTLAIEIRKKKRNCSVPERWAEMTTEQFLAIVGVMYGHISDSEFYGKFFGIFAKEIGGLDLYSFYVLNSLLGFTRKEDYYDGFIMTTLSMDGKVMVAPHSQLMGMTFLQFMMIDTFYTWYQQTGKTEHLVPMAAAMYLEEDEDFFMVDMEKRKTMWSKADETVLQAVAFEWTLIKGWLSRVYPHLFPKGGDEAQHTGRNGKVKLSNVWLEIFDHLVMDDLRKIDGYKRLECMDVMRIINRKIKDNKEKQAQK